MCVCVLKELSAEKEKMSQLEMQHHRVNIAYADVKSQIQHGDYKIENYDRVKTSVTCITTAHIFIAKSGLGLSEVVWGGCSGMCSDS